LLLDENGLGDHRTDAARTQESGKSSDSMNEKDDEFAHLSILAKNGEPQGLCPKLAIRQGQAYLPQPCSGTKTTVCIPGGKLPDHVVVNANHKLFFPENKDFQPRVGLAYRLSDKTAIRSGFGIFFEQSADIAQGTQNFGGNWPDTALKSMNNLNYPTAAGGLGPAWFVSPSPFGSLATADSPFEPGAFSGAHDPHIRNPYSQQWNLQVQRELAPNTVLGVGYVGSSNPRMWVGGVTTLP